MISVLINLFSCLELAKRLNRAYELIQRKGSRLGEPYHGQATSRHRGTEFQRSLTAGQLVNRCCTFHTLRYDNHISLFIFQAIAFLYLNDTSRTALLIMYFPAGGLHLPAMMSRASQSISLHLMQDLILTI